MCHRNGGNATRENFKNSNLGEQPPMGDYILRSKLGESSLSTVWKAEHRTTGEAVALKQIPVAKLTSHLRNCLECELTFLSSVNHPNIIRLLDFFKCEGFIILVLEFCAGGNLASFIRRHGSVQECRAKRFMQQLGAGLKVLTQNHIVHRDLKPENILLSGSECNPVLKIADFGLSRILLPDESAETVCGSPFYMAPEILQFQRYDEKVDMWSVGAILFELLNGYPPFHGRTSVQNIKESTSLPFSHLIIPQLHPDCIDLCSRLLSINPGLSNFTNNRASPHHTYGPQNSLNMLNHSLTSWLSLQVIVCPMRSFISTNFYKFEVGAISRC